MVARADEAQKLQAELRLWEQANQRRNVVLAELTSRVASQAERDSRLLRKLEAAKARLAQAVLREAPVPEGLALA
jgi:hypothetical protein